VNVHKKCPLQLQGDKKFSSFYTIFYFLIFPIKMLHCHPHHSGYLGPKAESNNTTLNAMSLMYRDKQTGAQGEKNSPSHFLQPFSVANSLFLSTYLPHEHPHH